MHIKLSNHPNHKLLQKLKKENQWLCWSYHKKPSSNEKIPLNTEKFISKKGRFAPGKFEKRDNWLSYKKAIYYLNEYEIIDGIGFVFIDIDFSWVDIDECIDDEMSIDEEVKRILNRFNSYSELSPSKKGIHIICEGIAKKYGWSSNFYDLDISVFDESWLTITQLHLEGYPTDPTEGQSLLNWISREYDIGKHG